jgi:AraC-like DNA-binding protein
MDDFISDSLKQARAELASSILRNAPDDGVHQTAIAPLAMIRCDQPSELQHGVHKPGLCIIAQGHKEVLLNDERYRYDPLHYLVVSVTLPVSGRVIEASPEEPYLCLRLDIDPQQLAKLIADAGPLVEPSRPAERGLYVERLDTPLLDAVLRLVRLLDTPRDIGILAPLAIQEILYRLLDKQGHRLLEIARVDSQTHRINRAIEWLNAHYGQPLRIEELAQVARLSPSALHHRFKAVTTMSPLQYQKQLRLQAARRLMLEGLNASTAGHRVGYESPSQFSREYSRLFGAPPVRDLERLRSVS